MLNSNFVREIWLIVIFRHTNSGLDGIGVGALVSKDFSQLAFEFSPFLVMIVEVTVYFSFTLFGTVISNLVPPFTTFSATTSFFEFFTTYFVPVNSVSFTEYFVSAA